MTDLRKAAEALLSAVDLALLHAPHRHEFDRVADTADDLRAALADHGKPQQRAKHVCDDPLCAVCGHPWAPPEVPR